MNHSLRRAPKDHTRCYLAALWLLALLPLAARAQAPVVTATPAGPLTLCAGATQILTATAAANVPGFNVAGSGFNGLVNAVAVQEDGKVLVGGEFTSYNGQAAAPDYLVRLNADGSLDNTFNNAGTGVNSFVNALMVQPDDRVLVGGSFTSYNGQAAAPDRLLRLDPNGSLDNTFNHAGVNQAVLALALQADSKVLVGGAFTGYNNQSAAPKGLLRLNPDGSPDNTFNPGGAGANQAVNALAVQPNDQVLVGGEFTSYNGQTAAPDYLLRLNANGSRDNTFNNGSAGVNGFVNALAVQPDDQVLVGGAFTSYNGQTAAPNGVLRLNADGSLDTTFNNAGAGANITVSALVVQPDGQVLIGGDFTSYNGDAAAPDYVLRLNADGSLDSSFNYGMAGTNQTVLALALQADGQVLVGGGFTAYNGQAAAPDRLLRLNPDGSLNNAATVPTGLNYTWSNGDDGPSITVRRPGLYQATATTTANGPGYSNVVRMNAPPAVTVQVAPVGPLALPGGSSATLTATATTLGFNVAGTGFNGYVAAVVVQADGKVLVGGDFTSYNGQAAAPDRVLRLNADGSLDNTFNSGGAGANSSVNALALQPDGKMLVGGGFTTYNGNAAPDYVLRLNADGSLDNTFNNGGAGANSLVNALALQADGKVLVGGDFTAYNGDANAPNSLLRLNADGSLDNTFNDGGTGANNIVNALAVQPDGQVLVGGEFTSYNGRAAPDYVLRLNTDGSLDNTFNSGGVGANNIVYALALQADGKVLVGGSSTSYNSNAAAPDRVMRLNPDGSLDTAFNNGGAGTNNTVNALAVQPDGKVLVGGFFTAYNGNAPDYVLRLNADGSLDNTFNSGGADNIVYAVAVQADGQVLVGGSFTTYNGNGAASDRLLRLNADGSLNNAATPLTGATFVFTPGNTSGPTRTVTTAGSYTATATDPASGCTYPANTVVVTVIPTPTISSLTPNSGTAGSPFAVVGTNLTGTTTLTFTPTSGPATPVTSGFVVASATSITSVTVPGSLAPGAYTVTVTTPGGTSNGRPFTVTTCPVTALAQNVSVTLAANGTAPVAASAVDNGSRSPCGAVTLALAPSTFTCANLGANVVTLTVTAPDGTTATATATVMVSLPALSSTTWAGTASTDWSDCRNWSYGLVPSASTNVTLPAGLARYPVLSSQPVQLNDLTLAAGATLTANATSAVSVLGNLTSGGGLRVRGQLLLAGSAPQTVTTVAGTDRVQDLSVNKPSGTVQLAADLAPDGNVTLSAGVLQTNAFTFQLSALGTLTETATGYIQGTVETTRAVSTPGSTQSFGGLGVALTPAAGSTALPGSTRARRITGTPVTGLGSGQGIARYFELLPAVDAGLTLTLTLSYRDAELNGLAENQLRLLKSGTGSAGPWVAVGGGSYDATANTATAANLPSLSTWTLGTSLTPLPVELVQFTAAAEGPAARLRWRTAFEQNSARFEVERSADGTQFGQVGALASQGTTASPTTYTFLDALAVTAASLPTQLYYRLRQVDLDGTFSYSPVRVVTWGAGAAEALAVFPNPARGGAATLLGARAGAAVQVLDALGRAVATATADAAGTATLVLPAGLPAGVYVVRAGPQALRLTVE